MTACICPQRWHEAMTVSQLIQARITTRPLPPLEDPGAKVSQHTELFARELDHVKLSEVLKSN